MTVLFVALGGALGAPARYFTDRFVNARHGTRFPWGTFVVNGVGSFLLGLVIGAGVHGEAAALVAIGFCGALTTYSTFSHETHRLLKAGHRWVAYANVVGSMSVGLVAVLAGYGVGTLIA